MIHTFPLYIQIYSRTSKKGVFLQTVLYMFDVVLSCWVFLTFQSLLWLLSHFVSFCLVCLNLMVNLTQLCTRIINKTLPVLDRTGPTELTHFQFPFKYFSFWFHCFINFCTKFILTIRRDDFDAGNISNPHT